MFIFQEKKIWPIWAKEYPKIGFLLFDHFSNAINYFLHLFTIFYQYQVGPYMYQHLIKYKNIRLQVQIQLRKQTKRKRFDYTERRCTWLILTRISVYLFEYCLRSAGRSVLSSIRLSLKNCWNLENAKLIRKKTLRMDLI